MNKFIIAGIMLISSPFVSFAQTSTTTVTQATGTVTVTTTISNPGFLPGDFFYFLDRWTEALNMALTFNNEKKARKHLENAKERAAEMGEVLKNPEAKLDDVKSTKDDLDTEIGDATSLVKGEKDKGNDVSKLAHELDDELDSIREALKDIFKEHRNESSRAETEIRAKLAALAPGDPQIPGLTQALASIMKEKNDTDKEDGDLDGDLEDDQDLLDDGMGKENSAQKHIDEAVRLKARLDAMAGELPASVVAAYQDLLAKAKAADARGDFETAKDLSKQAKKVLEKIQDAVEEADNAMKDSDSDNDEEVDESDVNKLEEEIKKGERMMEGLNR
ncbi:MAG: hypothetical protein UW27_C0002G0070 [Parcubacteria group bacterium GW2011_GWA1_44_13]|uniref:DUF5667 domain-containing protein n=1 Tax=Candidatus Nomurabacteria bacterium GW2011_GWB1_44_12 TaxID=1618748 RepID=A0A837I851_9BACT|nr:MAG: hypothetical protein UW17_C0014G0012 [Candidatus Nomurabacteria bacterium GW2011_GWD1_44_10]KKT37125.1 MAG: hypothetical protein UW25_C0002G0071 [Candidatus Nomurabacteria bacterium GW2011_GWB1_44_12]KKT38420.1 MAG: hypothetical protein UW27_C0002G0070 [Parcubacteria group bacterium GW2011_GWA1_44_13]KKT60753.1 MAG: hypothetical protein UW54_C0004G0015 [Parcubacteria group bacterium GW2011_GWC1_44_26]HBB43794.1 hypothetical protein [Candidatus Yonathbacteria bacterium]